MNRNLPTLPAPRREPPDPARFPLEGADSAAFLAAIVDSSDDAIVGKTLDGVVRSWNPAAERLFGWTADEAVGHSILLIIPPERHDEEREILSRLRRGERIDHFDTERVAKDGRRLQISLTVSPIYGRTGEIVGASKIARDISLRKQAEAALREADRRKDEFLATLAHELRNPLAPIASGLELLRLRADEPEIAAKVLRTLERQTSHLVRMVDDLLDVSRITRGKIGLRRSQVDLSQVVAGAVEAARPLLDQAGHRFDLRLPPEPLPLDADPVRLGQVLSNLLNNAARYTPEGGLVQLAAERQGDAAVVTVRDNGVGFAPEEGERLFGLFVQGENDSAARTGLGIGLTLVRSLVEMHGGSVSAASGGRGRGSTFTVRLPLSARAAAPAGDEEPETAAGAVQAPGRPLRVLIADDNRDAADALRDLLEVLGHRALAVYGGDEALAAASELDPEVVLLDLGMPGVDGYEAARRLRERADGQAAVLVALTGWGQEEDRRRTRAAGFDHHLVKPADLEALRRLLDEAGERPSVGPSARRTPP